MSRASLAIGVAVAASGAVLLGMEIAASRVLAPFFGNSLFVWGALIGIVLSGLSVGYWVGGALADRFPRPTLLVAVMGCGALAVLAIPFASETVLEGIVRWNPGPRLNPLLAAVALFGLPSVLLAAVSPIAVRLSARAVSNLGATAGRLFALSTGGSIAGTFATAFWLVPAYGTKQLLALAALVLFAAVGLVAAVERLLVPLALGVTAAVVAGVAAASLGSGSGGTLSSVAARNWSPVYAKSDKGVGELVRYDDLRVVHAKDTRYHRITVVDDTDSRYLRFDNSFQSGMYRSAPYRTRFAYSDYFDLGLAYNPQARRVLFIGLGGGSAPKRLWRDFPGLQLDVVELDRGVVDAAFRFFHLPHDRRLRVEEEDGRRYLEAHQGPWDVIAIDAFYADSIPFHLYTQEFLQLARRRLAPGGVVVTNTIGAVTGSSSKLFRSLVRTYRSVFPSVVAHPVVTRPHEGLGEERNIILVATDGAVPQPGFLLERWRSIRRRAPRAPDLRTAILRRYDGPVRTDDVPTLTDDYAPTDSLLLLGQ